MSSSSKETTTSETPTTIKEKIKKQLASQLLYYFSSKNLVQNNDVYLSTIMKLNSGHVPVSILSNFANVNKIVARSGILFQDDTNQDEGDKGANKDVDDSNSNHGNHDHDNATTGDNNNDDSGEDNCTDDADATKSNNNEFNDYTEQIHRLLREAALECSLLSLVTLDQNGKVVNTTEDAGASATTKATTSTTGTSAADVETDRIIRRFDAIGPSSEFSGVVPDDNVLDMYQYQQKYQDDQRQHDRNNAENETESENDTEDFSGRDGRSVANVNAIATSTSNATSSSLSNENDVSNTRKDSTSMSSTSKGKANIIIILRDVHEDATEEDVRQVFDESTQILDVVQEFGNCWFVTLDMDHDAKQDVVTTMLNLRQKTICSEPIKARLKTNSILSSGATPNGTPASDVGNNGNSYSNSEGEKVNRGFRSNYYSGRNPYHRSGVRNKASSTGGRYNHYANSNTAAHKNSNIYSGDRANFMNSKNSSDSNNHNGKKSSRGHFFSGAGSASYYGSQNYQQHRRDSVNAGGNSNSSVPGGGGATVDSKGDKVRKVQKNLPPPPPVVEEHYPTLAGEGSSTGPSSPTSIANLELKLRNRASTANSGYAAALLKAASPSLPPPMPVATTSSAKNVKPRHTTAKAVTNIPSQSPKIPKKKGETCASIVSTKGTVLTINTDDSSSDDKSSLSSKPESDSFNRATAATSPAMASASVWGGGRSFADVLKE